MNFPCSKYAHLWKKRNENLRDQHSRAFDITNEKTCLKNQAFNYNNYLKRLPFEAFVNMHLI
jgi:hypothetical protein